MGAESPVTTVSNWLSPPQKGKIAAIDFDEDPVQSLDMSLAIDSVPVYQGKYIRLRPIGCDLYFLFSTTNAGAINPAARGIAGSSTEIPDYCPNGAAVEWLITDALGAERYLRFRAAAGQSGYLIVTVTSKPSV